MGERNHETKVDDVTAWSTGWHDSGHGRRTCSIFESRGFGKGETFSVKHDIWGRFTVHTNHLGSRASLHVLVDVLHCAEAEAIKATAALATKEMDVESIASSDGGGAVE